MSYIGNSPGVASQRVSQNFSATAGQTVFTPSSGYSLGYLDVYKNGSKLINGVDYTASNGLTFTLTVAALLSDDIECVAYFPRGLSDGYLKSEADAKYLTIVNPSYTGTLTGGTSIVNLGSGQLYKDVSGNVGIGTSSPSSKLDVNGDIQQRNGGGVTVGKVENASGWYSLTGDSANVNGAQMSHSSTLRFLTASAERMRIDSAGNVGILNNAPTYPLDIIAPQIRLASASSLGARMTFTSTSTNGKSYQIGSNFSVGNGEFAIYDATAASNRFIINSDGSIAFGKTQASEAASSGNGYGFYVGSDPFMSVVNANASGGNACVYLNRRTSGALMVFMTNNGTTNTTVGNISHNGSTVTFSGIALSDARWKKEILPINNALQTLMQVNFVTFKFADDTRFSAGITAQQIETIDALAPYVNHGATEEDFKAVDYNALLGFMGKAIQEQQVIIDQLRADVETLKGNTNV